MRRSRGLSNLRPSHVFGAGLLGVASDGPDLFFGLDRWDTKKVLAEHHISIVFEMNIEKKNLLVLSNCDDA